MEIIIEQIKKLRDEHKKINEEQDIKYKKLLDDLENEKELSESYRIYRRKKNKKYT